MKPVSKRLTAALISLGIIAAMAAAVLIPALASLTGDSPDYYAQCDETYSDLKEALDSIGVDSSRENRASIAQLNGISDYVGTDAQDAQLLALLKSGRLVQSMPDPVETTAATEATTVTTTAATTATTAPQTLEYYNTYSSVDNIDDMNSCTSMQGMAVGSTYMYTVKINASTNANAFISMTNKDTGVTTTLINSATGGYYFDYLGHANDMDVWSIDSASQLFITTTNKGDGAIYRLKRSGSTLTKVASYNVTYNGSEISATGLAIEKVSGGVIYFYIKNGRNMYKGSISASATSGTIEVTKAFSFNVSQAYINGTLTDLTDWVNQGFDYYKDKIYIPLSGDSSNLNRSIVLVYDVTNASGTIYPEQYISFRITSSTYSNLFEIESCGICSGDGQLYFNVNRRKTSSDYNHDAVLIFTGYVDPDWS